jgi:hypothetical protein
MLNYITITHVERQMHNFNSTGRPINSLPLCQFFHCVLHFAKQLCTSWAKLAGMADRKSSILRPPMVLGNPSVAFRTPALRLKKFCAIWLVPGLPEFSAATITAFSHASLNCQCMLPCGNTVASSLFNVPAISWFSPGFTSPFSSTLPNFRFDPSTRIKNSTALGWIWGVFIPQGSRETTVMLTSRPAE